MSERLTKRKDYGCACWNGDQNIVTHRRYMELLDALAKYEDVIFDADGNEIISLDRLRELAEAERETYRDSTQVTGYCPICVERAKQEQQEPKPLTLEELLDMEGHPIWTSTIGVDMPGRYELCIGHTICACPLRRVLRCVTADGEVTDYELGTYEKTWIAYAAEPKGDAT